VSTLTTAYDARSITVLPGLEAVRRNPSMYVGSTGSTGLHQLVYELVDNAVDELEAGYGGRIRVTLYADGSCAVRDDGRGIPVDVHPATGLPACEVVLTMLHAGAKFDKRSYGMSAGLHGLGLSCVNALSSWLRLDVWRDGARFRQEYQQGSATGELERVGASTERGTQVWFRPDPAVFEQDCAFSAEVVLDRLWEIASLHPNLTVEFTDERTGHEVVLHEEDGFAGLLKRLVGDSDALGLAPVSVSGTLSGFPIEVAFRWTDRYTENIRSYVNSVRTTDGGSHVDGFREALAEAVNAFAQAEGLLDGHRRETIARSDVLEGVAAVLAVRAQQPRFDGQIKRRLESPEIGRAVRDLVRAEFGRLLTADPDTGRRIVERILDARRARTAARLAGRASRFRPAAVTVDYDAYRHQFGVRSRDWHESCSWLTDEGLLAEHAALCDVDEDARMLDVCCGSGVVGHAFSDRVGERIGLDLTPEMVRLASTRLDQVYQGTVYDLPFAPESFDLVVNREVLHLLPQPELPLAEIYRVLRPGGQFIVGQIMPYADADAFWMYRIFKKKQPLLQQMFREADFRSLLLGAGFTDLTMSEYLLWESIDRWIDTFETTPIHRQEIYRLFHEAPAEVRAVHPFELGPDGSVRDQWRWCVYSLRKPL
jgi:DNA gyrase subunit B